MGLRTGDGVGATDGTLAALAEPSPKALPDEALKLGTMVGEYKLLRKLARGAMGEVYEAVHPVIGKTAAVKVITRRLSVDPAAVGRFIQEARSVNQIGHVNIVDVFAFGELPDGRAYYVMEWLAGESLYDRLQRGPMDPLELCDVLEPVCDALEAAHEKGVIHRDLKPDNVSLVEMRGNRVLVKLLDFGIAKLHAQESEPTSATPTETGVVMGTPGFISPEQARGKEVDNRTDIYSLGCMAFQMLTGRLPFPADNSMDMIAHHLTQPAPRVSSQRPSVPAALDDLILSMMAKRADDRPALTKVRHVLNEVHAALSEAGRSTPGGRQTYRPRLSTPSVGVPVVAAPAESKAASAVTRSSGSALIDPSEATMPAPTTTPPRSPAATPSPTISRSRVWVIAVVALVAVTSVVVIWKLVGNDRTGTGEPTVPMPSTTAPDVTRAPAPAPAPAVPPTPAPAPDLVGGMLMVTVEPADATVTLDGHPLAVLAGAAQASIDPDVGHIVLVSSRGYQSMQFDVRVTRGERMKVPVRLVRGRGKQEVASVPVRAPHTPSPPATTPASGSATTTPPVPPVKKDKDRTIDPFGGP